MRSIITSLALLALPASIHAVSLADLVPRAENLPQGCSNIYTAQIPQCTKTDFTTKQCSQKCVNALFSLVQPIQEACGNQGVTGKNLIVAYLAGVGPEQICHNIQPSSGGASSPMPSASSSPAATTTKKKTTVTSGILTATSMGASDSSSLVMDTSSTPTTGVLTSPTSTSGRSPLPSQLNTHDHSGGGSPFDTAGNLSGAGSLALSGAVAILSATLLLFNHFR